MKQIFLSFSLLVLSSSLACAQSAEDIINKYINAMGGKDKVLSVKSLYMEGSMDFNGSPVTVKYWIINKKSVRYEYTINGMTSYDIVTNDSGWAFSPIMGQKQAEPMTKSMIRAMQPQLDPEGLLMDYKQHGYTMDMKGKDDVDGTPAYKIVEHLSDSVTNTYYFDTTSFYILRITTKATVDGKVFDLSRDFGDYKKTPDGYTFPMNMGLGMALGSGEVKFTIVKVNTDMDPELFKPKR